MKSLRKRKRITVRFTDEQARKIDQAADLESRRRREAVDPSTLVRELVLPRVDAILASAAEKVEAA